LIGNYGKERSGVSFMSIEGFQTRVARETTMRTVIVLSIASLILILAACEKKKNEPIRKKLVLVEAVEVRQGKIANETKFTGDIEASAEINIFPKISAKIEAMKVDVEDSIKKDDVIAILESDELRAQWSQAKAALQVMQAKWSQIEVGARPEEIAQAEDLVAKARANLKDAEHNYKRMKALSNRKTITERQLESAELALIVAKADLNSARKRLDMLRKGATKEDREALSAQVNQAKAALDLTKIRMSYARIVSPIDGIISARFFDPGDLALPARPLVTIVQMDSVKVIVHFPENQFRHIVRGIEAQLMVASYPGKIFYGKIDQVSPTLNPATRMFSAEIKVMNEERLLRPGMFATVTIAIDLHSDALLVPKDAVLFREKYVENQETGEDGLRQIHYVYTVEDGKAHMRQVSLGHVSGNVVEINEGVKLGGLVVVRGQHQLNDGEIVKVVKVRGTEK
jgi:RND family efflux transporter MFP subunit